MRSFSEADLKPSGAIRSGQATALPNADTTKLKEALARMDAVLAVTTLQPVADPSVVAEKEAPDLPTDASAGQHARTEQIDHPTAETDARLLEIQRHAGNPAYEHYLLALYEAEDKG